TFRKSTAKSIGRSYGGVQRESVAYSCYIHRSEVPYIQINACLFRCLRESLWNRVFRCRTVDSRTYIGLHDCAQFGYKFFGLLREKE
ncbi:hypothetical protein TELCIR_24507, partial [Teladorsagia circumcincta]